MNTRTRAALATPLLLSLMLVGACAGTGGSGGSGGDSKADSTAGSSAGSSEGTAAARTPAGLKSAGTKSGGTPDATGAAARTSVAPLSRAVISTGQVTLHAAKLAQARAEVMRLVTAWGGTVADEQTEGDDHGRITDSTLTLRVPTARFDAAMNAFSRIGDVEQQSRTSEDVTTKVIDNQARIRAAERSIRSIEGLLSRATRLSDVIAIESDLARRQADLDSLKRQEAWLADQTSLSTITVYLSRPVPREARKVEARGFLAGLEHGWSAMQGATVVGLTAVGALLPFLLAAGLLGLPLWLLVRRRRPVAAPTAEG